jgi:hypothetical protein
MLRFDREILQPDSFYLSDYFFNLISNRAKRSKSEQENRLLVFKKLNQTPSCNMQSRIFLPQILL